MLPRAAYDSDDGFGGGFQAEYAQLGREPYDWAVGVGSYLTVRGYHDHRLRWDRTGPVRWTLDASWRQWTNDGYWGIGGVLPRERDEGYRYRLTQPFAYLRARAALSGPWSVYGGVHPRYSDIGVESGSLLDQERPYGVDGGFVVPLTVGVLYDTRSPEVAPQDGVFAELSARAAPWGTDEAAGWWSGLASVSGFRGVGPVVLAGRLMGEWLGGSVPFYEMVHWGSYESVAGFGGGETIRGVPFGRWRGPGKVVANAEVRWNVGEHGLLGRTLAWEIAPFADAGMVLGVDDLAVHSSAGLGVRPILDGTFVGRVDVGVGSEETESGTAITWGLYVTFGHAF